MVSTAASPEAQASACSFCGKPQSLAGRMIRGENAQICTQCIEHLHQTDILDRQQEQMLDATDDA